MANPTTTINLNDNQALIQAVAGAFYFELTKHQTRLDLPKYRESSLSLVVTLSEKPSVVINFSQGYSNTVSNINLKDLMTEVYRRAGYNDKAEMAVDAASSALLGITYHPADELEAARPDGTLASIK